MTIDIQTTRRTQSERKTIARRTPVIAISIAATVGLILIILAAIVMMPNLFGSSVDVVSADFVQTSGAGYGGFETGIRVEIKNESSRPISSFFAQLSILEGDRSVPRAQHSEEVDIPGGIEPSETKSILCWFRSSDFHSQGMTDRYDGTRQLSPNCRAEIDILKVTIGGISRSATCQPEIVSF